MFRIKTVVNQFRSYIFPVPITLEKPLRKHHSVLI